MYLCVWTEGLCTKEMLSFSCLSHFVLFVKFSQYVNISHRVIQRSIIKIQVTNFLTLGQEKTRKARTGKDSTDFIGILMH